MSYLTSSRSYFRSRLNSLGYKEWTDGFNVENIPKSLLDGSYHISSGSVSPTPSNHQVHEFVSDVLIRVYLKGYRDPAQAIDKAFEKAELVLGAVLLPSMRLAQDCIKDIEPGVIDVEALSASNDNSVILNMNFSVKTFNKF